MSRDADVPNPTVKKSTVIVSTKVYLVVHIALVKIAKMEVRPKMGPDFICTIINSNDSKIRTSQS